MKTNIYCPNLDNIKTFYSEMSDDYDLNAESRGVNKVLHLEVDFLKSFEPRSVLEFGVGTGRFAQAFLDRVNSEADYKVRYVGVDISPEMLAKISSGEIEKVQEDFLVFIENTKDKFDACVAPYTVICDIDTAMQVRLVNKILTKSKILIVNVPTIDYQKRLGFEELSPKTFFVPGTNLSTSAYFINKKLREQAKQTVFLDSDRELLVFDKALE